ncbi:hypothetical protein [Coleofasciculus sp.]|uniref:hypothetical protein n=1 Tax=Coleofasciculus sp. TaxID=3100458 RepID=UPI0039F7FDC5
MSKFNTLVNEKTSVKTILILGATGYVGGALCQKFCQTQDFHVVALVRPSSNSKTIAPFCKEIIHSKESHFSTEEIEAVIREHDIKTIAEGGRITETPPPPGFAKPKYLAWSELLSGVNLMKDALTEKYISQGFNASILYPSSVYGASPTRGGFWDFAIQQFITGKPYWGYQPFPSDFMTILIPETYCNSTGNIKWLMRLRLGLSEFKSWVLIF